MRLKRNIAISIPSSLLTLALARAGIDHAHADEIAVGIYPTLTEITGHAGDTLETQVQVKNTSATTTTLTTLLQPFTASGQEDGSVRYLDEAPDIFRSIQIFDQRERVNQVTLAPDEEKTLTVRIHIPEDDTSRDYYYSLVLLTKPVSTDTLPQEGVSAVSELSAGVATHFLFAVNPESRSSLKIAEFSAPSLTQHPPVGFTVRVSNLGPNFTKVRGEIEIGNILGSTQKISIPETTVLTQSTRALRNPQNEPQQVSDRSGSSPTLLSQPEKDQLSKLWETKPLLPGIYRAQVLIRNDRDSQTLTQTIYFAVAPIQIIVAIFIIFVLAYFLQHRLRKKYF